MATWQQASDDGAAARRNGEPRDPTPYLPRYAGLTSAKPPERWWLSGWDEEDERIAVERSRLRYVGEVEWSPVRRLRPE